jgi:hypothetical protein
LELSDVQTTIPPPSDERERAVRQGREEAIRLEERLRRAEAEERRRCLASAGDREPGSVATPTRRFQPSEGMVVERLRKDIERLAGYQAAVEASRVWRAAQWARRVLRRSW